MSLLQRSHRRCDVPLPRSIPKTTIGRPLASSSRSLVTMKVPLGDGDPQENGEDDANSGGEGAGRREGQLVTSSQLFQRLERAIPLQSVVHVVGYGSGVFDQQQQQKKKESVEKRKDEKDTKLPPTSSTPTTPARPTLDDNGDNDDAPLVDLMVVVNDAVEFHRQNYLRNPSHYESTPWPWIGSSKSRSRSDSNRSTMVAQKAARIQRRSLPAVLSSILADPGFYYVVDNDVHRIKYGVVHQHDFLDDVSQWTYLYGAGRLHKPTITVYETPASAELQHYQHYKNLWAALSTALLMLSASSASSSGEHGPAALSFPTASAADEGTVYEEIAGLSYAGDFRMRMGAEDPRKIRNLVRGPGSFGRFRELYRDAAAELERQGLLSIQSHSPSSASTWTWDTSNGALRALSEALPPRLKEVVVGASGSTAPLSLSSPRTALQRELHRIVAPAARYQSLKGLVTAGSIQTSVKYALRKLRKGWGRG